MKAEINLEGMEFYAYHGLYEQEQMIGNRFIVDIFITFEYESAKGQVENLSKTIDYEKLYACASLEMRKRYKLLETLAEKIIDHIHDAYPSILFVKVSVTKLHPPVGGHCDKAKVTLQKEY